ncbi:MAG: hypothetical protein NTY39_02235 [Campylobacterales bacterium]|nr:hypothetical protein [Campylobacterales bacterium]
MTPFDITQYLDSEETMAQYFTQLLEEGVTDELIRAIGHIAQESRLRRLKLRH